MSKIDDARADEPVSDPFGAQQRLFKLLSQDTRHKIIQMLLGHPDHLASLDELVYMTGKSSGAIRNQLNELEEADIIDMYPYPENMDEREYPAKFYGFTPYGVRVLDQYNYLSGLPVMRALYARTKKDEKVETHAEAPRPSLPETVRNALTFDESGENTEFDGDDEDGDTPLLTMTQIAASSARVPDES
ncbi:winged helix-turn-helix domain-containing protein [Salinigranum halophilum]|uniref:winged helix-turn-helix domain-containing protein n=1 Tax=Salinigranum halophilum TaxID=2565931 RepID=UPI00191C1E6F|nr:winged helix-turn-helix domain-containing protein [Salinigranum halophilum]